MPNMDRSNRLRLVIKNSGKTAKDIINEFHKMDPDEDSNTLPRDPITISRHINAKRGFDCDVAQAYAKALDADPATICFDPVMKNIVGKVDAVTSAVRWYEVTDSIVSVRVPREFYHKRYRVLEQEGVSSHTHGSLLFYESIDHHKPGYIAREFFNQMGLIKYEKNKVGAYVIGVAKPLEKKRFMIISFSGQVLENETEILKIHPVVGGIFPSFYRHHKDGLNKIS